MKSFLSFLVISTLNIWFVEIKNSKFWCTRGRLRLRTSFGIWSKKIIWFLQQIICLQLKKWVLRIFILLVGLFLRPCLLLFFVNFLIFSLDWFDEFECFPFSSIEKLYGWNELCCLKCPWVSWNFIFKTRLQSCQHSFPL